MALQLALAGAGLGAGAALAAGLPILPYVHTDFGRRALLVAVTMGFVGAAVGALVGWILGGRLAARLVDLGLAVAKLGRGGTEVKVRYSGNDEVAALGRSLQYLAGDLAEAQRQQEKSGGALVTMDPQVRQFRDKVLPPRLPAVDGYELDGALAPGSRGGLDYFDVVALESGAALVVVTGEGASALAVVAARLARDEVHHALRQGSSPRAALEHANKVLASRLPTGCCAKATVLELRPDRAVLLQAGARAPLLVCARGEVRQVAGEGLALGLDEGRVFAKGLQPVEVPLSPGVRLCLGNESVLRAQGFLELVKQHSPKHTAMFMNMVLGGLEQDAGPEGLREDALLLTAKKS